MRAKLMCQTVPFQGLSFDVRGKATIGRSLNNDIVLQSKAVSDRHATITFDSKSQVFFLEDLGSQNGTKIDGVRISRTEKLTDLCVVTFAEKYNFIFQIFEEDPKVTVVDSSALEALSRFDKIGYEDDRDGLAFSTVSYPDNGVRSREQEVSAAMAHTARTEVSFEPTSLGELLREDPKVTVIDDFDLFRVPEKTRTKKEKGTSPEAPPSTAFTLKCPAANCTFRLREGQNLIGRSRRCEVHLNHPSVSRWHAAILVNGKKVTITDLDSKNHTYVRWRRVRSEKRIKQCTPIRFGDIEAVLSREAN